MKCGLWFFISISLTVGLCEGQKNLFYVDSVLPTFETFRDASENYPNATGHNVTVSLRIIMNHIDTVQSGYISRDLPDDYLIGWSGPDLVGMYSSQTKLLATIYSHDNVTLTRGEFLENLEDIWEASGLEVSVPPTVRLFNKDAQGHYKTVPVFIGLSALFYRKPLLDRLNLSPPSSFAELLQLCRDSKRVGLDSFFSLGLNNSDLFQVSSQLFYSFILYERHGFSFFQDLTAGEVDFVEDPRPRDVLNVLREMMKAGCFPAAELMRKYSFEEALKQTGAGRHAVSFFSSLQERLAYVRGDLTGNEGWRILKLPDTRDYIFPNGTLFVPVNLLNIYVKSVGVPSHSSNKAAAKQFIANFITKDFLSTEVDYASTHFFPPRTDVPVKIGFNESTYAQLYEEFIQGYSGVSDFSSQMAKPFFLSFTRIFKTFLLSEVDINRALHLFEAARREAILSQAATPMMEPQGGTFVDAVFVKLVAFSEDTYIRYTLDGSEPSATSTLYSANFVISAVGDTVVKARAFKKFMNDSSVSTFTFTIHSSTTRFDPFLYLAFVVPLIVLTSFLSFRYGKKFHAQGEAADNQLLHPQGFKLKVATPLSLALKQLEPLSHGRSSRAIAVKRVLMNLGQTATLLNVVNLRSQMLSSGMEPTVVNYLIENYGEGRIARSTTADFDSARSSSSVGGGGGPTVRPESSSRSSRSSKDRPPNSNYPETPSDMLTVGFQGTPSPLFSSLSDILGGTFAPNSVSPTVSELVLLDLIRQESASSRSSAGKIRTHSSFPQTPTTTTTTANTATSLYAFPSKVGTNSKMVTPKTAPLSSANSNFSERSEKETTMHTLSEVPSTRFAGMPTYSAEAVDSHTNRHQELVARTCLSIPLEKYHWVDEKSAAPSDQIATIYPTSAQPEAPQEGSSGGQVLRSLSQPQDSSTDTFGKATQVKLMGPEHTAATLASLGRTTPSKAAQLADAKEAKTAPNMKGFDPERTSFLVEYHSQAEHLREVQLLYHENSSDLPRFDGDGIIHWINYSRDITMQVDCEEFGNVPRTVQIHICRAVFSQTQHCVYEMIRSQQIRPAFCLHDTVLTLLFVAFPIGLDLLIPRTNLSRFLLAVETQYLHNPYHNHVHAAEVTLMASHILFSHIRAFGILQKIPYVDMLSVVLAAAIHDVQHLGLTAAFLTKARHPIALLYNDISPLENHHVSVGLQLIEQAQLFTHLTVETQSLLRRIIVELVLATDMKMHFDFVGEFRTAIQNREGKITPKLLLQDENLRLLFLKCILKLADLGHSVLPLPLHRSWVRNLAEEFFAQGDLERELLWEISPFMNRKEGFAPSNQVGFFQYIINPLVDLFKQSGINLPNQMAVLQHAKINQHYWESCS